MRVIYGVEPPDSRRGAAGPMAGSGRLLFGQFFMVPVEAQADPRSSAGPMPLLILALFALLIAAPCLRPARAGLWRQHAHQAY